MSDQKIFTSAYNVLGRSFDHDNDSKLIRQEIPATNFQTMAVSDSNKAIEHWIDPSRVNGDIKAVLWHVTVQNTGATTFVPSTQIFMATSHQLFANGVAGSNSIADLFPETQLAHLALLNKEKLESFVTKSGITLTTYQEDGANTLAAGASRTYTLPLWDYTLLNRLQISTLKAALIHRVNLRANPQITGSAVDGKLSITASSLVFYTTPNTDSLRAQQQIMLAKPTYIRFSQPRFFTSVNNTPTAGVPFPLTLNNITGHVNCLYLIIRPSVATAAAARTYQALEVDKYDSSAFIDVTDGGNKSVFGNSGNGILATEVNHVLNATYINSSMAQAYPGLYIISFGNSINRDVLDGSSTGGIDMDGRFVLKIKPTNAAFDGVQNYRIDVIAEQSSRVMQKNGVLTAV